jgi:hypothetical protein
MKTTNNLPSVKSNKLKKIKGGTIIREIVFSNKSIFVVTVQTGLYYLKKINELDDILEKRLNEIRLKRRQERHI